MRRLFRENGLSIVLLILFLMTWIFGQAIAGLHEYNNERAEHGLPPRTLLKYFQSAHFLEATSENWESEFFQMAVYVALTVFLFQKGSSESKNPYKPAEVDRDPRLSGHKKDVPWPVRHGGWVLVLYEHSLTLVFLSLFFLSFGIHLVSGCANYNEEQAMRGLPPVTYWGYLSGSRFWFESLQNWQSEFLAIFSMVVLSIFLRQRGSPESKPVDSPHHSTEE